MRGFIIAMAWLAFIGGLNPEQQPVKPIPKPDVVQPFDPTALPPIESIPDCSPAKAKSVAVDSLTGIGVEGPSVIMVSAAWCGPCQVFKNGPMPDELTSKGWTFIPIDVVDDQWKHIKVKLYPTYRIYDGSKWVQVEGVLTVARMKAALNPGPIRRVFQNAVSSVNPTPAIQTASYSPRWQNHDGKSRMQHAVEDHGMNISGKSEAQVLREMDEYHDRYGDGHPVKSSSVMSSGCPTGGCPTSTTQRRGFFTRR